MGIFGKIFSKEACVLCGSEVGALHRSKLRGGEYVCSDCASKCSEFVRLSELQKEELEEHIAYMEKRNRIYEELFKGAKQSTYFGSRKHYGIAFADELGMLAIINFAHDRVNTEVIRYDEIQSYEGYEETSSQDGGDVFKEDGVIIRVVPPDAIFLQGDNNPKGLRPHAYIKREMKLCMRTEERETSYVRNVVEYLDGIFGVHDNTRALFSFHSKQEKRDIQAVAKMSSLIGDVVKGTVKGEIDEEAMKEKFEDTAKTANLANTGGMSQYTDAANQAEEKVS